MEKNTQSRPNAQGLAVLSSVPFTIDRQLTEKPGSAHSYHYHNAYEMYYLFSGDRYYFIKDKTYHAKRGSLVMIKPYEIHCASDFSDEPYERILITFKKRFIDELSPNLEKAGVFKCFDENVHIVEFSKTDQALVENVLYSMLSEYKNGTSLSDSFLKASLTQLLLLSAKNSESKSFRQEVYHDAVHKTVSSVAAYINNNYSADISLSLLAERFFMSPCYLSRSFKKVTGSSLVEYINGVRIKEAQRLLLKTDMKISEIADAVGFKSVTHFGRAFKSIVKASPLGYRKRE